MPTKQPKVLIVEDVPRDAEMMIYELQQAGLCGETRRVSDKPAMFEALREFVPDVILSDFTLPNFDGLTALVVRQQVCPDTPFIIVSGSVGEERAVQILKAGATDYVLKYDLTRLATAVERALADSDAQRDRKRIARELEAERRLLSKVLGSSSALIALLDTEGKLVRINPAAATACGLDQNAALGQSYAELFVETGQGERGLGTLRRIVEGHRFHVTLPPWRELNRIGRMVLWSVSFLDEPGSSGETTVLAGIDITEQQQQEETRARLAAIIDSSDDAIMSKTLGGVITSWNGGAERIYGYTAADVIGKTAQILVPPGHEDEEPDILDRIKAGESLNHFETVRRRKDGRHINVSMTISPMRDAGGRIIGVSHISRDISEQKLHEELRLRSYALEAENARVLEASRLKSEFLANMSHELRTPLNAIIGFADLLHDERVPTNSSHYKEFLGHIRTSGHHLLQLINDILDLSKVEAGKLKFFPEPLDLERTVNEVTAILRSTSANKQVQLSVDLDPTLGQLVLDPARLKQVLYNYLSNALKFTPTGGRVIVRARAEGPTRFRLEIEDTGPGITQQDAAKLFVEFEQLDGGRGAAHPGTGLGLALTKRLVEAQGGTVGLTSTVGKGSVFHAVLPRVVTIGAGTTGAQVLAAARRPGAPTVLVVEDDEQDQALLVRTLTEAGFQVETATTGAQAITRARDEAYTAITLDLLLPDMTGLEILAAIRAGGPNRDVPVVVVTVIAERASVIGFAVTDILAKPVNKDALLAALRRVDTTKEQPANVLVVNDDMSLAKRMGDTLEQIGYHAVCMRDGTSALDEIERTRPHAIILDLHTPDGFDFLERLKQLPDAKNTPVLLWTDKELDAENCARLTGAARSVVHHGNGDTATLVQDLRAMLSAN